MTGGGDVTRILGAAARGDADAPRLLLPLVYRELRRLAADRMAREDPGQTLQATALVHEAYLRLVDVDTQRLQRWDGRGHFFAAAAEAMRRILIERARRRRRVRHGGGRVPLDLSRLDPERVPADPATEEGEPVEELLALDDALARLEAEEPAAAAIVKLRYFVGMSVEEAARSLGISVRTADRHWAYAKAWLYERLSDPDVGRDARR